MKVIFPQNIKKGFFSWLGISIMWFNITMIQMFIMAVGIMLALATFSTMSKSGAKELGFILAIIIFLFFAFVTFFNISEMNLLEFIVKKLRDLFLDTTKKFQINFRKTHPTDVVIAKSRSREGKQKIEIKGWIDLEKVGALEKGWLL